MIRCKNLYHIVILHMEILSGRNITQASEFCSIAEWGFSRRVKWKDYVGAIKLYKYYPMKQIKIVYQKWQHDLFQADTKNYRKPQ